MLDNPPLPEELASDTVLGALKLVAWSGDDRLLPRAGDRGAQSAISWHFQINFLTAHCSGCWMRSCAPAAEPQELIPGHALTARARSRRSERACVACVPGRKSLCVRSGFPHWGTWAQRNTRFSADVGAFLAGAPGTASAIATRLALDLFIFSEASTLAGALPSL